MNGPVDNTVAVIADQGFMARAMELARSASLLGEVPVGCLVVCQGQVVAESHNAPISTCDPTGHAEIRALREAGRKRGNYRLPDCDLFVTLEPCAMCAGAMVHARIRRLVFAAADPRTGAAGSVIDLAGKGYGNHQMEVVAGLLADQSGAMLKAFFAARR